MCKAQLKFSNLFVIPKAFFEIAAVWQAKGKGRVAMEIR